MKDRFWLDKDFHSNQDHVQRCTEEQWRDALLHKLDTVKVNGEKRKLQGTKLGFGVVEVTVKKPMRFQESNNE